MFKYLKDKLFYNKKEETNDTTITEEKEEQVNDREVLSVNISDMIEIIIREECTLDEYSKNLDKYKEIKDIFMPIKILFTNKQGSFSYDTKIIKQRIYIIDKDNLKYFITKNDDKIQISQYKTVDTNIIETKLEANKYTGEYKITKSNHDLNHSTGEVKWYPMEDKKKDMYKHFILEIQEAFSLLHDLLNNLEDIENINKVLNIYRLCLILNIAPKKYYYPVISDDIITLSCNHLDVYGKINKEKYVNFDIVLNETNESVGKICFDYTNDGFSYCGNVSYDIKEKFRNNHYATRALNLLKELLKDNEFEGDKNLYIATLPENIKSQKVIENNNGNLIYDGDVPKEDSLYFIDGVKKVKVYKININNK